MSLTEVSVQCLTQRVIGCDPITLNSILEWHSLTATPGRITPAVAVGKCPTLSLTRKKGYAWLHLSIFP